jgi:hypothetical protein
MIPFRAAGDVTGREFLAAQVQRSTFLRKNSSLTIRLHQQP